MERPQFESLSQELAPVLQGLEAKRKELKAEGNKKGIIGAVICFVIGMIFSLVSEVGAIGLAISVVIAAIVYYFCVNSKSGILSSYYKEEVIVRVIHAFCENVKFTPGSGISEDIFCNSGLFNTPDRYHAEDLIEGCLEKTDFSCSEVHAEERKTRVGAKGKTEHYWVDIFKGFLFIADFHKDFKGKTTILRNSLFRLRFGESRVKMESPDFEKTFDVYSTDQVEARYLITPSMMERLLELDRKFGGGVTVSFRNSTVLVAIPDSTNHFEASIWSPVDNMNHLESEFGTIYSLIAIVNDLNLNTRIWSKE